MEYSIYLNGVFESVLEEIRKAQSQEPDLICYLQPYASEVIVRLAESPPTEETPTLLYISLTSSLPLVSFKAEIVGWENKGEIDPNRLKSLNEHIRNYQPGEESIYMKGVGDKPAVNLISIRNMERLATPIPVSSFSKISDSLPLKSRTRSGGWSYVKKLPSWVGTLSGTALEEEQNQNLEREVSIALKRTSEARAKRLESAPRIPEPIQTFSKSYRRNPDVVAEVLLRANGYCEICGNEAPFKRAKDGTPYLEVHHKIMLAEGGDDTVNNAVAGCPNCHRKLHFG